MAAKKKNQTRVDDWNPDAGEEVVASNIRSLRHPDPDNDEEGDPEGTWMKGIYLGEREQSVDGGRKTTTVYGFDVTGEGDLRELWSSADLKAKMKSVRKGQVLFVEDTGKTVDAGKGKNDMRVFTVKRGPEMDSPLLTTDDGDVPFG